MVDLEPTPELIAAARRCVGRRWTFGPEGCIELATNPHLAALHGAGYVRPHFVSAGQQITGRDDYYRLTDEGMAWFADHDRKD
jgi:hypothetical protein